MAQMMLVNPKKRKAKRKATKKVVARRSPTRRAKRAAPAVRRRRRNPIGGTGAVSQIQNAAVGAAGALAVDVAMAKIPLPPAMVSTPGMRAASQGVVSLLIGMGVSKFGRKSKLGRQLAEGGLTVAMHGVGKSMIGPATGLPLAGYNDSGLLGYGDNGLLGYQELDGWNSPAPVQDGFDEFDGVDDFEDFEFDLDD